jgi:hypothetical protein
MVKALLISKFFDKETAFDVRKIAESIDDLRWTTRTALSAGRAIDNSTCHYDFCGHAQMPAPIKEKLKELAPVFEDFKLAEIAINRYNPGDYLGKHKDRHYYRRNLVISLQENGDGLFVDDTDEFVEDVAGQGVLFEGIGPAHSVPPVSHSRYTLIYLYE